MGVHVGEIHTELSGTSGHPVPETRQGDQPRYPGAAEDAWRAAAVDLARLRARVYAEDFED
ncbi:hypothetical protein ACWFNE_06850 [Cellulomonas sp. NPDC055163]